MFLEIFTKFDQITNIKRSKNTLTIDGFNNNKSLTISKEYEHVKVAISVQKKLKNLSGLA